MDASAPKRAKTTSGTEASSSDAALGTTRSSACPSSNAHQPTHSPGASVSSAARATEPFPTTISSGSTPTSGVLARAGTPPRRRRGGAGPTARLRPCRRGASGHRTVRFAATPCSKHVGPGAGRAPNSRATPRYHGSTVTPFGASLRAFVGRIGIAVLLCVPVARRRCRDGEPVHRRRGRQHPADPPHHRAGRAERRELPDHRVRQPQLSSTTKSTARRSATRTPTAPRPGPTR